MNKKEQVAKEHELEHMKKLGYKTALHHVLNNSMYYKWLLKTNGHEGFWIKWEDLEKIIEELGSYVK